MIIRPGLTQADEVTDLIEGYIIEEIPRPQLAIYTVITKLLDFVKCEEFLGSLRHY